MARLFLRLGLSCLLVLAQPLAAASPEAVHGRRGMVASRSQLASAAGVEVMRQGGNAIDAAVATAFALAVTYPSAGNLGGGGFMVIRLADGSVVANDFREVAPAAATRDMYLDAQGNVVAGLSTDSHLAVGVPGTVDGLLAAQARHGRLDRAAVLSPAIRLAREGFPLSYDLARDIRAELPRMQRYPATMAVFTRNGQPYEAGDTWRQPDLAATLERIRDEGRDGFYAGRTARDIVAEMQRGGGLITLDDLANYRSRWREPVRGTYRGYEIHAMPPPSSGGVLIVQMLNMLEPFDVAAMGYGSAARAHLLIEAERRAYADRAEHLGDPDFHEVPLRMLTDRAYARARMRDFDPQKASSSAAIGAGSWPQEGTETTHASIADADGNAVALTTTLNLGYGARIVVAGSGFLLNNEMDDFSAKDDTPNSFGLVGRSANAIAPGKRMLSSMSPTIVTRDGKLVLVTGSPGGSTIITTVLQVIVNSIDHGMDVADAVALPRFHHQWTPDSVTAEAYAFSPDTEQALRARGHANLRVLPSRRGLGDANTIRVTDDGELLGVSDPRNDGGAVGW
jgi:gamma-glutamyltranspeptidase/glutathione hydrolase